MKVSRPRQCWSVLAHFVDTLPMAATASMKVRAGLEEIRDTRKGFRLRIDTAWFRLDAIPQQVTRHRHSFTTCCDPVDDVSDAVDECRDLLTARSATM